MFSYGKLERAIERAVAAERAGKLRLLNVQQHGTHIIFTVNSTSRAGVTYTLTYDESDTLTCDCPAGENHLPCVHLGLILHFGWPYAWPQFSVTLEVRQVASLEPTPCTHVLDEALDVLIAAQMRDGEL